ncbi:MAG: FkbM family methyltransferase, partial [Gemmatimonadetes bacterium]|nr:FkbM family methyltransferase [Gemmatimonadota bacterium]
MQTRLLGQRRVWWGERALLAAARMARRASSPDVVRLDIEMPARPAEDFVARTVFLDLRDARFLSVVRELHDPDAEARRYARRLASGDTMVDVGANHGTFAMCAAAAVGASGLVVAVEPQPRLADLVERSLAANGDAPHLVCPFACGDERGEVELFTPRETSGSAGIYPTHSATEGADRALVPLRRFDDDVDWRSFPGTVHVKLDVEGSELAFLRGASDMIRAKRPAILLEW